MPRTKNVNGKRVPLTPDEEAEFDAREAEWAAKAPERAAARRAEREFLQAARNFENLSARERTLVLAEALRRLFPEVD